MRLRDWDCPEVIQETSWLGQDFIQVPPSVSPTPKPQCHKVAGSSSLLRQGLQAMNKCDQVKCSRQVSGTKKRKSKCMAARGHITPQSDACELRSDTIPAKSCANEYHRRNLENCLILSQTVGSSTSVLPTLAGSSSLKASERNFSPPYLKKLRIKHGTLYIQSNCPTTERWLRILY